MSLGYKEGTVDPSVYVKFKIVGPDNAYLLAWTTTPWTLPGNVALAVGKSLDYVKVRDVSGDVIYMAAALAEQVLKPGYEVLGSLKGNDLLGIHYEPLYKFYPVEQDYAYVVAADYVSIDDGTGSLIIEAKRAGKDTMLARIVEVVAAAQRSRAPIQKLADAVAGWFVPAVIPNPRD
mgnify:CR=1 FL=1